MIYELIWWTIPLVVLPLAVITNFSHEVFHGLAIWPWGWQFKTYILAHFFDSTTGETHYFWKKWGWFKAANRPEGVQFYFARCDFIRTSKSKTPTNWGHALINIASRFANTIIIAISAILVHVVEVSPRATTILAVWVAANLVDALVGFYVPFYWKEREWTDLARFHKNSGWNIWWVRLVCLVWYSLMVGAFLWR